MLVFSTMIGGYQDDHAGFTHSRILWLIGIIVNNLDLISEAHSASMNPTEKATRIYNTLMKHGMIDHSNLRLSGALSKVLDEVAMGLDIEQLPQEAAQKIADPWQEWYHPEDPYLKSRMLP
jgi:hypothetical protein